MLLKLNLKNYLLLSLCLFCCSGQDYEALKELNDINQEWLRVNGIPEVARLFQYPPYSFHSEALAQELDSQKNGYSEVKAAVRKLDGKCSDDVLHVIENVESPWAIQMLDSDGKLESGLKRGGLIWAGDYKECISVHAPADRAGHGNFNGQYCVSSWRLHLEGKFSNLSLSVGLCIPDSCTGKNLLTTLKNSSHILDRFPLFKKLHSYVTLESITCKGQAQSFDAASIIYLTIVSFLVLLVILGSSFSVVDFWKPPNIKQNILLSNAAQSQSYGTLPIACNSVNSEKENLKKEAALADENEASESNKHSLFAAPEPEEPTIIPSVKPDSAVKRILLSFSVFTNGERILDTKNISGQLLTIHGIRFLSLSWVILGHTYISAVSMIGNKLDVLKDMDTVPYQMLLQSPLSVDSFFLLSGFLLSYLFFKEMAKKEGKVSWLYFYLHRIWRLTPAYLIAVFFYMLIFKHLGSGPFWNDNQCDNTRGDWWKYVLYINNFIPIRQLCVGWSWYLANDMQFYIISPLFLCPLWKWPKVGFSVLGAFLLATWTITGIMSYHYDLIPMFVGATTTDDLAAYTEKMWDSFDWIYDKPYTRIAPYLIGIALGYVLHRTAERKNFLSSKHQLLGWTLAAFCSLSVVFGLYHVDMSRTLSLFYNSLSRSSYSIGLAWLIYACETGHGGFLTKLLSWKLFVPLSRLTYCTYLIHPMIIHGYYQSYLTSIHFTNFFAVTNFMGFLLMSYMVGFLYSLAFESPFMNLEKLVIKKK